MMPPFLAAALAKLGLGWGATWCGSKDTMHFDLDAKREIPTDAKQQRNVQDLFPPNDGLLFSADRQGRSFLIKRQLEL
jgi:D-alanyl-D-alanine carboxypeptidase